MNNSSLNNKSSATITSNNNNNNSNNSTATSSRRSTDRDNSHRNNNSLLGTSNNYITNNNNNNNSDVQSSSSSSSPKTTTLNNNHNTFTTSSTKTLGLNGLKNIGNTCFMNSVIQCLSNTKLLLEYLRGDSHMNDINTSISSMKGALIKSFADVIKEVWSDEGGVVNTVSLKSQIQRFAPRFIGYAQQDAQEFLRYLLEGLHEDVNRVKEKPKPILTEIDEKLRLVIRINNMGSEVGSLIIFISLSFNNNNSISSVIRRSQLRVGRVTYVWIIRRLSIVLSVN